MPAPRRGDSLAAFGTLSFAYFATIGLFNPYAPLWFQHMGLSTLAIGALSSMQAWTRVVAPYAWSWAADHRGNRHHLLRAAAALTLLASLGYLAQPGAAAIAVITALLFLANGGIAPLSEAALVHRVSSGSGIDAGRYGRVRVWGSIGFVVSVSGCGALLQATGIEAFPWFVVAMGAALLAAAWVLPAAGADDGHARTAPPVLSVLRRPAVAWFFASAFFTVLAHSSLYAFFSLYLVSLGYGKAVVGALWAVAVACEIVFFWTQGAWFHRLSPHRWLQAAAVLTLLRFAGMAALGGAWWVLVLAQATHAVTFAGHHAACVTLVDRWFPGAVRSRGQALYTTLAYGLSGVVGGVAGGALGERHGFAALFWAAAAAGALAWACVWRSLHADRAAAAAAGPRGASR